MRLKNVFISSYTFIYEGIRTNNCGPTPHLLKYLKERAESIYLLEQPLPGSDSLDVELRTFKNGMEIEKVTKNFFFSKTPNRRLDSAKTYIRLKIRDALSNVYFFAKKKHEFSNEKVDLFIGLESINAAFGIMMRKAGLVDKVVYYIFDWAPDRYRNPLMNRIYVWLDKFATYNADYTWNITYTIGEAREDVLGYDSAKMSPQIYVPYCVDIDEGWILADDSIDTDLIVYAGGLIPENGPGLLIEAFKLVHEKFPRAKLLLIGGGHEESELRAYADRQGLNKNIEFTGFIADEAKIIEFQKRAAIGVAPYPVMAGSRKPFGDVIKIRMYIACGLVTVTTPVPPVSREIEAEELGWKTKDDSPGEIAAGICRFLEDKELLFRYRRNVIAKARASSWQANYHSALSMMGLRPIKEAEKAMEADRVESNIS